MTIKKYKEFEKTIWYEFDRYGCDKPIIIRWLYRLVMRFAEGDTQTALKLVKIYDEVTIDDLRNGKY